MATIKALECRTVHQIQSGQVIVDLCSVVKELVENSLDAGATSIDVRFKNHGLDAIEVQDNGNGISSENYETIALKHYTSKLSSYDDLSSLQTFGFRGEALSSLCALSKFHITTARTDEAPKGTRLDFEDSGKLRSTQVVASQKGTTVVVEDIFGNLPVRRRELEKNIKREYGKALGVLQAYACVSIQARISVSNMLAKGKKVVVFTTRSSPTNRENIANIFGAKTLQGLIPMDLSFEMRPTRTYSQLSDPENKQVRVFGNVSRPTVSEGRQTPDRQMFFVNARPCALPQVAKIFNEVYKSYNNSQSPFVFANIIIDTNAYDVNVSPDKRTILLHEQYSLLDSLKMSLSELFEGQDQTVPISQKISQKLPPFKQLTVHQASPDASKSTTQYFIGTTRPSERKDDEASEDEESSVVSSRTREERSQGVDATSLIEDFVGRDSRGRASKSILPPTTGTDTEAKGLSKDKQKLVKKLGRGTDVQSQPDCDEPDEPDELVEPTSKVKDPSVAVEDFNERLAEQRPVPIAKSAASFDIEVEQESLGRKRQTDPPSSSMVQNAFDRMRPRRNSPQVATITIGSKTMSSVLGSSPSAKSENARMLSTPDGPDSRLDDPPRTKFSSSMRSFAAPGSELIKTVGRPQSKTRASISYLHNHSVNPAPSHSSSPASSVPGDEIRTPDSETGARVFEERGHQSSPLPDAESDSDYADEDEEKAMEEARVSELIRRAEEASAVQSQDNTKRAYQILKGTGRKDCTTNLIQTIDATIERINEHLNIVSKLIEISLKSWRPPMPETIATAVDASPEERLSLSVSKADFTCMHIIGQFNLGFILAARNDSDLFIIDQHASDEKYNFERLQATTVVQNQRLVQPRILQLTAIEEEIIFGHNEALLRNGFLVDIDNDCDLPVGQRCKLTSLPMSREVVFDVSDLEELIALLADSSASSSMKNVPRPGKIRRMFAMRACRSSVMVGKTLTLKQMGSLVRKMAEIDKPWNCPHGRPTMRHLCGLEGWKGWSEGDGLVGLEEEPEAVDWGSWVSDLKSRKDGVKSGEDQDGEDEEEYEISDGNGDEEVEEGTNSGSDE